MSGVNYYRAAFIDSFDEFALDVQIGYRGKSLL